MRKTVCVAVLFFIFLFNTGCWDIHDINKTSFVIGLGVDLNEDNPAQGEYRMTFEIIRSLGVQEEGPARIVKTVDGLTISECLEYLQTRLSRPLSLAHVRVLVVGEKFARIKGFNDLTDYIQKNAEIALRTRLFFSENTDARDIFLAEPLFRKTMTEELIKMAMHQHSLALTRSRGFHDFSADLHTSGGRGLGSRVIILEDDGIVTRHGGAVFDNWKLVGWLSSEETRDANWLISTSDVVVDCKEEDSVFSYKVNKRSTKISPAIVDGKIRFLIQVSTEGSITEEKGGKTDLEKRENIKRLERLFSQKIKAQVESAVKKARDEFAVDYLGLGEKFKNHYPREYETVDWKTVFPGINFEVEADANIIRFGLAK